MEIDNSKDSAIHGGKWSKPNSSFYDKLIKEDNYKSLINEAFLIHGDVNKDTKYSSSGCKYPHHSIKNGKLVVNEAGVRAAYNRAKQMGVYHGKVKSHLEEHIKELGIFKDRSNVMKENFEFIEKQINDYFGTNLSEDPITDINSSNIPINESVESNENIEDQLSWIELYTTDQSFRDEVFEEYKTSTDPKRIKGYKGNLYFISTLKNLDGKVLKPNIPENFLTKHSFENNTIPRICFTDNIAKCLTALSKNVEGEAFSVYQPDNISKYDVYKPSAALVPDVNITGERWILKPVTMKFVGNIKCTGSYGKGMKYKYGNSTAELYKWKYIWVDEVNVKKSTAAVKDIYLTLSKDELKMLQGEDASGDINKYVIKRFMKYHGKTPIAVLDISGTDTAKNISFSVCTRNDSKYRGKGYATALLAEALAWFNNQDKYTTVYWWVRNDNKASIKIAKSNGFKFIKDSVRKDDPYILFKYKKARSNTSINESAIFESAESSNGNQITNRFNIVSTDGANNCCIKVKGYDKPMRGRSTMIILKCIKGAWSVFLKLNKYAGRLLKSGKYKYSAPGGGWEPNEDPMHAAIRECHEETHFRVRDVSDSGLALIEYSGEEKDVYKWIKEHVPDKKDWWYGYYSRIFVGEYGGVYKGHVKPEDEDEFKDIGKWFEVKDPNDKWWDSIYPEYKKAIFDYIRKHDKSEIEYQQESVLISEPDIYWNKDKFDNGDINLCFITGLSGSGKSTMGSELQKKGVEWYQLDDLLCVKSYFSMTNLKEYGDLIYSFFNGIGKKWYIDDKDLDDKINTEYKGHYADIMYPEFVHYAMDYAKKYPSKKFVLEGVWLYCSSKSLDGDAKADKHWFRPEEFKKYAFYIKGTSAIISSIRAAKRDSRDGDTKWECFKSLTKNIFSAKRLSYYLDNEKELILFRDYFKALVKNKKNGFDESAEIQDPEIRSQLNWITEYANDEVFREADNNTNDVNGSSDSATDDSHQPESIPKQTDKAEANKNGVNRKKLYIAFIEWCKKYNNKNTFGSHFDKDVFNVTYPFVPDEMRYFYRLADPTICVLSGDLTFFQLSELRKVNSVHNNLANQMIFAAAGDDSLRVFNKQDKKVYKATLDEKAKKIILGDPLGNTFDLYIQNMIKEGDFLNAPPEPKEPVTTQNEEGADNNGNNQ